MDQNFKVIKANIHEILLKMPINQNKKEKLNKVKSLPFEEPVYGEIITLITLTENSS